MHSQYEKLHFFTRSTAAPRVRNGIRVADRIQNKFN
jgi:hypothetical protein